MKTYIHICMFSLWKIFGPVSENEVWRSRCTLASYLNNVDVDRPVNIYKTFSQGFNKFLMIQRWTSCDEFDETIKEG